MLVQPSFLLYFVLRGMQVQRTYSGMQLRRSIGGQWSHTCKHVSAILTNDVNEFSMLQQRLEFGFYVV